MHKNKKIGKIIYQIIPPLFVSMVVISIISLVMTFFYTTKAYIDFIGENSHKMSNYVVDILDSTDNIEWLLDYWQDNYEDMNVDWNDLTGLSVKKMHFSVLNPELDINGLSVEELEGLGEDSQRLYAEINFIIANKRLDRIKQTYDPTYLYVITILDDGREFFFMCGKKDNEYRGQEDDAPIFTLGKTLSLDYSDYHVMKETFDSGKAETSFEETRFITEPDKRGVHFYSPFLVNGKTRALVGVSMDTSKLTDNIIVIINRVGTVNLLMFIALVVVMIFFINGIIISPLVKVQKAVKSFGNNLDLGKLDYNLLSVKSRNEIKDLANEVGAMGNLLVNHIGEIEDMTQKQEKINSELSLATAIQNGALPTDFDKIPKEWGINIFATMHPAKEVGGDLYDYMVIDDDHLAILIGDVSGKSVPGALYMMLTKVIIENECMHLASPAEILARSNKRLCDNNKAEMFVTVWLGIYEISTGILRCANAGHEYPIIKKADGAFELYKDKHGIALGVMNGIKYRDYELSIDPGDVIMVYSDGIPEAVDIHEKMYGTQAMIAELNACVGKEPKNYIEYLLDSLFQYTKGAEQFDDITMMAIKFDKPLEKQDKE